LRVAGQQSKRRPTGSELRFGREGQIYLEAVAQQEHAIEPRIAPYVQLMYRAVLCVHPGGPVGDHGFDLTCTADAEGQIDVGPAVFASHGRRAGQRHPGEPNIGSGCGDELGAHSFALFWAVRSAASASEIYKSLGSIAECSSSLAG